MTESLLTILILFGATLVSSTFGFGSALFSMPLLTLLLGLPTATPLFGLVGPTIATIILALNWQQVETGSAWRLVITTFCGIPIGIALIKIFPGNFITHLLGLCLIGFGCYRLLQFQLPKLDSSAWALPFGVIAGILGGAYNTNGPPVVIYGEMRRWSPAQFRATLQSYFLPTGLGILLSHALAGLWTAEVFRLYLISLPGIFGAIALGGWINQHLPVVRFQTLLSGLLILLGLLLWI